MIPSGIACKYKPDYTFISIICALILLCSACIELRISDEEAIEALSESKTEILFDDLEVSGKSIHYAYTDHNKKKLLVFVHGSPGSWSAFIDYFKMDSIIDYFDVVAVDRAGFGKSSFGEAEPSMAIQAAQINAVANQFRHQKKILIGHSLGGPIIARMAMDYPTSYHGMILVAPSIDPKMEKKEWYRGIINTKLGAAITPKEFEVSNDEILPLKSELELMIPLWNEIIIPTIVLQGTKDRLVPKENADFAAEMIPDSLLEIRMLEGVDHFIPWSHPHEIKKAIHYLMNGF